MGVYKTNWITTLPKGIYVYKTNAEVQLRSTLGPSALFFFILKCINSVLLTFS